MRSVFPATPLQRNVLLSERYDADIWLKREDLSPVRSYKIRGAFNAMRKQQGQDLFVCASAGNHAQGVAYMCKHLNVKGVIFMPVTTPQQKIQKTRIFGGDNVDIHLIGDYFDDTLAAAQAWCAEQGGHFLSLGVSVVNSWWFDSTNTVVQAPGGESCRKQCYRYLSLWLPLLSKRDGTQTVLSGR